MGDVTMDAHLPSLSGAVKAVLSDEEVIRRFTKVGESSTSKPLTAVSYLRLDKSAGFSSEGVLGFGRRGNLVFTGKPCSIHSGRQWADRISHESLGRGKVVLCSEGPVEEVILKMNGSWRRANT